MTCEDLVDFWKAHHEREFLKWELVPRDQRMHERRDVHAYMLLGDLVPGHRPMVSSASHDEIWLDVTPGELAKRASEDDILALIRAGVRLDRDMESFCMFV